MPSKRYSELKALVDSKKQYSLAEAVALVKKTSNIKFDAAVELHVRLGIDATKGDQQVRGTLSLPHGTGKSKRVAAIVEAEKEAEAKAAGADMVGGQELIDEIARTEKISFDVVITTPTMMPKLSKLAKFLGPKGLMPNPKNDTIGPNVTRIVQEQKAGKISFKNDSAGNVHQVFGRASFEEGALAENLHALLESIKKAKPSTAKGIYIQNAVICTTMGPAIHLEISMG